MLSDYFYENVAEPIVVNLKHLKVPQVPPVNLEAAAILISVEKLHCSTHYARGLDLEESQDCRHCSDIPQGFQEDSPSEHKYPCSTLVAARSVASPETIKYVAVYLERGTGE